MRHVHLIGKTGMGKSTLLQHFIRGLIETGHGVGVLDPHSDLASFTLDVVPKARINDVVYLNLADPEHAPALNLVSDSIPAPSRPRVASALVSAFHHVWADSWGPRLEYILHNSIRTLLDCQNVSLIALPRLLTDFHFRQWVVKQTKDPFLRAFWIGEFEAWDKRFRTEAIAPILNKLGAFAINPALRAIVGQVKLKVDFRNILDSGGILAVNLAKDTLGDEPSRLLGALITSSLGAAAMERASVSPEKRRNFVLILDEAHCFLSGAISGLLSESRKFGLGLVLAHQFLGQLPEVAKDAVLGNAGSTFAFRTSGEDAEVLARNFGHSYSPHLLVETPPFQAHFRPWQDDQVPQKLKIAPILPTPFSNQKTIVRASRMRYCSKKSRLEEKLTRWAATS